MKLYTYGLAPNATRVLLYVRERGLDLEIVEVNMEKKEHKSDAFLAINPKGQLPALVLDDGTALSESLTICRYLEELHGPSPLLGLTPLERAVVGMWERRAELGLFIPAVEYGHYTDPSMVDDFPPSTDVAAMMLRQIEATLPLFEEQLRRDDWLAGPDYTLADITAWLGLRIARLWSVPMTLSDPILSWESRVRARPGTASWLL